MSTMADGELKSEVLPFLLWARVWSQLVSDGERGEAWHVLELPSSFEVEEIQYWNAFHAGLPAPPVPLLLHGALGLDGANAREDWMRVSNYLGLEMTGNRLPPDHLAAATEVFAMVVDRGEVVIAEELCERYLLPWCVVAEARLKEVAPSLAGLPVRFGDDLRVALGLFE